MKPYLIDVQLTDIELNYIDSGLRYRIRELEKDIAGDVERFGRSLSNAPALLRICERTQAKLSRIHSASYRKRMGEKKWRAHRRMIAKMIRAASLNGKEGE